MDDVVIRSTSTNEERKVAFKARLRLPRVQGCRYAAQGTLLGATVEVRIPQAHADKLGRATVVRDDAHAGGIVVAVLADGHVLVVRGGEATTLGSALYVRKKPKPGDGDPNAGDDEDGHEPDPDGDDGGAEETLALSAGDGLDECADGEGAGWDVGQPEMVKPHVQAALGYVNEIVAALGAKMPVLDSSGHPASYLPLSGRLRGLWVGWVEDSAGKWQAFIDRRGLVAMVEAGKMPAFFRRDLTRFPLAVRRRSAPVKSMTFQGMEVSVDKPFGSVHEGMGRDGKPYMNVQRCDYGFFPGSRGEDGEEFDCYIGPNPQASHVHVVRQVHMNGQRDELKAMMGFDSHDEAKEMHLAHVHPKMHGGVGRMKLADFKSALKAHQEREKTSEVFLPKTEEDGVEYGACKELAVHCGLGSDNYNTPWPTDKTDFPNAGDNRSLSLRNSEHARMPLEDMDMLCGPMAQMMAKTTGFPGHTHTEVLRRLSRAGTARTDAEVCSIKCREAYGDLCMAAPPTDRGGMMKMASFGLVHPMGLEAMRAEMKAMKADFDGEGGTVDAEEMSKASITGFGGMFFPGSPPMQPSWTPMSASAGGDAAAPPIPPAPVVPAPTSAAVDPGAPAPTPIVPKDAKDADAAGVQGTPLLGGGEPPKSTGEGEDSPAPPVTPPVPQPPPSNSAMPGSADHKGGAGDYPNDVADPSQLTPGQPLPPVNFVEPLPVPDRAANPVIPRSGSTMNHGRLETLIRAAAVLSILTGAAGADPTQRDALLALTRGAEGGGPRTRVPGGAPAAAGAPGRTAQPAGVPHARGLNEKRYLDVSSVKVTREAGAPGQDDTYLFVGSTAAIDSYNESVEQSWDFSRFETNPVILFCHNSHDLPIGKAVKWEVSAGQLLLRIRFSKVNPMAVMVQAMIDEGMICAGSVGFMPGEITTETIGGERRTVLKDNLLHEYSICAVPANPEALYVDEKVLDGIEGRMLRAFNEILRAKGMPSLDHAALVQAGADGGAVTLAGGPAGGAQPPPVLPVAPIVSKGVVPYKPFTPSDTDTWDAAAADKRLRKKASSDGSGSADKMDWKAYASYFAYVDEGKEEDFGGHKLLHHDVLGDKVVTAKAGVMAAGAAIQGARGGVKIPDGDLPGVKAHLAKHYKQFDLTPPWERDEDKDKTTVPTRTRTAPQGHGDTSMAIHDTNTQAAIAAFRKSGRINLACTCGEEHSVDLTQVRTMLGAAEQKATSAEEKVALHDVEREKAATKLGQVEAERDKAVANLTKLELGPITGVELYMITPHDAETLVELRRSNPGLYEKSLASAKSRFDKGATAAQAAAVASAAAAGLQPPPAPVAGSPTGPAPVTRTPDPTAPVDRTTLEREAAAAAEAAAATEGQVDTAANFFARVDERTHAQLGTG